MSVDKLIQVNVHIDGLLENIREIPELIYMGNFIKGRRNERLFIAFPPFAVRGSAHDC